jgi:predicted RNase H-like HicB family nuclease
VTRISPPDPAVRNIVADMHSYTVSCEWDPEAQVYYVADSDVPGLASEAPTLEALESKLHRMIPELLELNAGLLPDQVVAFELVAHKRELFARRA